MADPGRRAGDCRGRPSGVQILEERQLHPRGRVGWIRELAGGGWVVSPNRGEAAACAGLPPEAIQGADPVALAAPFLEAGAEAVWLKGGHAAGDTVQDLWITAAGVEALAPSPRLAGQRRGTGCTLASAWLALRLRGQAPLPAAELAAAWLRSRWGAAHAPGGVGRPQFLADAWAVPA